MHAIGEARRAYIERYVRFFESKSLARRRLMVYQHSAVGRDLLVDLLREFGADLGFFVYWLPFENLLWNWAFVAVAVIGAAVILLYALTPSTCGNAAG